MNFIRASFSWSARREGNSGYVLETRPDGSHHEFGPMPSHIVPAFLAARRRVVELKCCEHGFAPVSDPEEQIDWSFLNTDLKG